MTTFSKTLKLVSVVALLAFGAPAFAEGGGSGGSEATGIGTGIASATSNVNGGKSYNLGGSVGAAQCANAFSILGVAASMSDKGCDLVMASVQGYQAGLTTREESRTIYFAGVKRMGVTLESKETTGATAPAKSTKSDSSGAITVKVLASSADEMKLRVNGKVYVVNGKALSQFKSGMKLTFGAAKLRMSDLPA